MFSRIVTQADCLALSLAGSSAVDFELCSCLYCARVFNVCRFACTALPLLLLCWGAFWCRVSVMERFSLEHVEHLQID